MKSLLRVIHSDIGQEGNLHPQTLSVPSALELPPVKSLHVARLVKCVLLKYIQTTWLSWAFTHGIMLMTMCGKTSEYRLM